MHKKLFFRVDANANIGRGHLSRCLAMAEMLKHDFEISFISLEENSADMTLFQLKFPVDYIAEEVDIFDKVSTEDMVCLDGYHFTENYKKALKNRIYQLIEINDMPYQAKNVDVIFNHTPGISKEQFGNTTAEVYLGLEYALLRKSFLDYAKQDSDESQEGDGVFICFGGADTYALGLHFVQSLLHQDFSAPIYWVTHQTAEVYDFDLKPNLEILHRLSEQQMIEYMLKSKVLLIPSSVLSIEAMALRKPFFTGYFVDNQKLIHEGLQKQNLAVCYGYMETHEDVKAATDLFLTFYNDEQKHKDLKEKQRLVLSGHSGEKISETLLAV